MNFQEAKTVVQEFYTRIDIADPGSIAAGMNLHCAFHYLWRGVHPFNTLHGARGVAETFWEPLHQSFTKLQRREQIFLAGENAFKQDGSIWVVSMGHLLGLFDEPFLGFEPTRKVVFLRYAEFHRVEERMIHETALYLDILDFLSQIGANPLATQTGTAVLTPSPRTQDGLLRDPQSSQAGIQTLAVMNAMLDDLTSNMRSPKEELLRNWEDDMTWFGPGGIGTTYIIDRYREQHSTPFEDTLEFVRHNGHQVRMAEGHYSGFFGYPSLTLRMKGDFMGLPACNAEADMRIVDIYRRKEDKLAENWIFIDMPHFLKMQGIDILGQARA
ncbi:MAG: nuclear transport factor 2 family protein [Pseudomonadota bacterium]